MANNAAFVSFANLPTEIRPGDTFTPTLTFLNTGTTTWTTAALYRAGLVPHDNIPLGLWQPTRLALTNGPVAPGQPGTFSATLTVPPLPAAFWTVDFSWQLVQENVEWFGGVAYWPLPYVVSTAIPTRPDISDLRGCGIFNTQPFPVDSRTRYQRWYNQTGTTMRLIQSCLWCGATNGCRADIIGAVRRIPDGSTVAANNWDHYADPVAPNHAVPLNLRPGLLLYNGEGLELSSSAALNGTPPPGGWTAHHGFSALWQIDP